jgi:hypothetical protein
MRTNGLEFFLQRRIRTDHKINVPDKAQGILFDSLEDKNCTYFWNWDNKSDTLMLANSDPREDRSEFIDTSEPHSSNPSRTTIPTDVIDRMGFSSGDPLYYFTHDDIEESNNPTIFIWSLEELESAILDMTSEDISETSRYPNF